jgi:hypothetical protein
MECEKFQIYCTHVSKSIQSHAISILGISFYYIFVNEVKLSIYIYSQFGVIKCYFCTVVADVFL